MVSINSPSGEGGGLGEVMRLRLPLIVFPLILLQAKAGGFLYQYRQDKSLEVSINSPSGEGGGIEVKDLNLTIKYEGFPLILLQAKAGG